MARSGYSECEFPDVDLNQITMQGSINIGADSLLRTTFDVYDRFLKVNSHIDFKRVLRKLNDCFAVVKTTNVIGPHDYEYATWITMALRLIDLSQDKAAHFKEVEKHIIKLSDSVTDEGQRFLLLHPFAYTRSFRTKDQLKKIRHRSEYDPFKMNRLILDETGVKSGRFRIFCCEASITDDDDWQKLVDNQIRQERDGGSAANAGARKNRNEVSSKYAASLEKLKRERGRPSGYRDANSTITAAAGKSAGRRLISASRGFRKGFVPTPHPSTPAASQTLFNGQPLPPMETLGPAHGQISVRSLSKAQQRNYSDFDGDMRDVLRDAFAVCDGVSASTASLNGDEASATTPLIGERSRSWWRRR